MSNNQHLKQITKLSVAAAAAITTGAVATTAHADTTTPANSAATQTKTQSVSDLKTAQNQSRATYANANQAQGDIQAANDAQTQLSHDQTLGQRAKDNLANANQNEQKAESMAKQNGIDVNSLNAAQAADQAANGLQQAQTR